jgi:hypothetical protein
MKRLLGAVFLLAAQFAFGQVDVTAVTGTVKDPSGAAVPGATIVVTSGSTNAKYNATSGAKGDYAVPALSAGPYTITVTKAGFKTATISTTLIVGVPSSVDVDLQVGATTETVQVTAGATLVQAETADVSTNITGRQLTELPFATRNAIEMLVDAPGTSTPTTPRSSSINGLPKGAINVTIDGMNTQDNNLKSSDGYFSYIYPSVDALEEVTMTTSAAGVDSTGQGGAQIKFVTKSGTNNYHGGVFWQVRNTVFNANYYFNNNVGLGRDIVKLNQGGGHLGAPIIKNKLFFFGNVEIYRFPGTNGYSKSFLTPSAASGIFTYADSSGNLRNINVLALGSQGGFKSTPDPLLAKTYALQNSLAQAGGILKPNTSSGDYNTTNMTYQPTGEDKRNFYTTRLDYNITQKHQLSFVYNFDGYASIPDFLNGIVPDFPGTGTVLGSTINTGQRSNRFDGTFSLRSVLKTSLTNEFRAGLNGGTVLFFDAVSPGAFSPWLGFNPSFANPGTGIASVTTTSGPQRRNAPVKNIGDTATYVRGTHQISFGFNWDQINLFQKIVGSAQIPGIAFGIASGDPITTGSTNIFTTANFPGATTTQLSSAANLFADVTGRVSSITQSLVLGEGTKTYGANAPVDRDQLREFGLFITDQWRVTPRLTANIGLRAEKQLSFTNLNNLYSQVSFAGLYGISGVGNLFSPGTLTGSVPNYTQIVGSPYNPPFVYAPSVGLAYSLPTMSGLAKIFTGGRDGAAVLRAGYSIATVREGMGVYQSLFGSNQGISIDDSVSPSTYPAVFGAPGSVNFSGTLPSRTSTLPTTPTYPIAACFTCSLNGFDPHLRTGYVQSWNLSYQRELDRNTVVDFRYTGNHGTDLWRQLNINEVNIFQSGWLTQFQQAQNNLAIARGGNINLNTGVTNWGNQGLPGQVSVPLLTTAIGNSTDSTTAGYLTLGQAGTAANATATNQTRLNNLIAAGYPANLFQVNPTVAGGGSFVLNNSGSSYFNALQIEVRRRLSRGLTFQGSYQFGKSEANGATGSSSDSSTPTTLRNQGLDRVVSGFDIRHGIKFNSIYELPFGPGRQFGGNVHNFIGRKLMEGWQISGVVRLQSGTPLFFQGLGTFNGTTSASGVILHNITASQFQSEVGVYKSNLQGSSGPIVFYLPPPTSLSATGVTSANNTNIITNTLAAYNLGGFTTAQVDPNAPYISAAPAGQLGWHGAFYLPWQKHVDLSLQKNTKIGEKVELQITAHFLDAFNFTNFLPTASNNSTGFGQITSAYRDISGTVDPGARVIEFLMRVNF